MATDGSHPQQAWNRAWQPVRSSELDAALHSAGDAALAQVQASQPSGRRVFTCFGAG
ncbi:MAG: hypothetical protein R2703_00280 [Micropruina glycogenica]|jgi:hypothetical protein|nr:hypothetical protein [Propionibacteriaceae bacterium]